tara:strand:- start:1688 stop:1969 length:282 start_codon:yes stop_codon:yes gene_type:complete
MKIEATITRVGPIQEGRNFHVAYRRIKLKDRDGKFYMTDLSPKWRNWLNWEHLLKEGNVLGNLKVMGPGKIDGDSEPTLVEAAEATHTQTSLL